MSTQQIQRCIRDVLASDAKDMETEDWSQGNLKRLFSATSTLYRTSLNKVMLRSDEETVRGHICALMACEKLAEKQDARNDTTLVSPEPRIQYFMDRIPLEPKKIRNLISVFKQNISQCSPVKNIQWSPSPKKSRSSRSLSRPSSPLKSGSTSSTTHSFTSQDPKELRKLLFSNGDDNNITPTKSKSNDTNIFQSDSNISPTKLNTPRRKLKFELTDDNDNGIDNDTDDNEHNDKKQNGNEVVTEEDQNNIEPSSLTKKHSLEYIPNEEIPESSLEPIKKKPSYIKTESRGGGAILADKPKTRSPNLFLKRYVKLSPSDIIKICNTFELPRDVAYNIIDEFLVNATYLVYPWQLVCGLILHCTFVVYNEKRRKDPRLDHLILSKMLRLMKCDSIDEISNCLIIVKQLIIGEDWFRNLQIKYNYFSGFNYEESISIKLGSMLQSTSILFSNEQYENWKRRVLQDLSLRSESDETKQ